MDMMNRKNASWNYSLCRIWKLRKCCLLKVKLPCCQNMMFHKVKLCRVKTTLLSERRDNRIRETCIEVMLPSIRLDGTIICSWLVEIHSKQLCVYHGISASDVPGGLFCCRRQLMCGWTCCKYHDDDSI